MNKENESGVEKKEISFIAQTALKSTVISENQLNYYIDSGSTQHFCNDINVFTDYEDIDSYNVSVANGDIVKAIGKGKITIEIEYNGNSKVINLSNVQFTPEMTCNLISVRQLAKYSGNVYFTKDSCIISKNNDEIVVPIINDSYLLRNVKRSSEIARYVNKSKSLIEWHERLGHISFETLKEAVKNKQINGINILDWNKPIECKICLKGKQTNKWN
jgi:hypothetical protein